MDVEGTWASLPLDLLVDIFRRLEVTAVVRCAGTCKPWRRAITDRALSLRPRPDRFFPDLLLGFMYSYGWGGTLLVERAPGPLQSALVPETVRPDTAYKPYSLIPLPAGSSIIGGSVLSSRGGSVLLRQEPLHVHRLFLWNPVTGAYTSLPTASFGFGADTYVLVPDDYDHVSTSDEELDVRILAVEKLRAMEELEGIDGDHVAVSFRYQLFSPASGMWGEVVDCSVDLKVGTCVDLYNEVVCRGGAVHWLGRSTTSYQHTCTLALDVRTGRMWTTELPEHWALEAGNNAVVRLLLAASGDGRLSVIRSLAEQQIQVWVLAGGDQWTMRRVVEARDLLPKSQNPVQFLVNDGFGWSWRSGFVHVHVLLVNDQRQELLVDVETGSSRPIPKHVGQPGTPLSLRDGLVNVLDHLLVQDEALLASVQDARLEIA